MIRTVKHLLLSLAFLLAAPNVLAISANTPSGYANTIHMLNAPVAQNSAPMPQAPTAPAPSQPIAQPVIPVAAPAHTASNEFVIVGGDVLQVTVWKEEGMDREIVVLPDGTITFPLIGTIAVQGMTPLTLQNTIKEKLATLIPDAAVTVSVKAPTGHTVSVLGQVTKPGEFVMTHTLSVMQALSEAGGLTPYASERSIIILRHVDGKKVSIPFPYDDVAEGQRLEKDIDLQPGDVVFVPTAGLL